MLISEKDVWFDKYPEMGGTERKRKLNAIEIAIRNYTHNNFQNKLIRFEGTSKDNKLIGYNPYLKVGDTVEISQSVNNGLYVIKKIENNNITFDDDLFDYDHNLVTKIEYPQDIIEGALKIFEWDLKMQNKVGVQSESETLSRHSTSTTYKSLNKDNSIDGRPLELFGFCNKYVKARY